MKHHWRYEKIVSLEEAGAKAEELRLAGKKIVTVNGSFDLLHAGHLDVLEEAKQQGDVLVVMINSDRAISLKKGSSRPIISEEYRAAMLAALTCVDFVVVVDGYDNEPHGTFLPAIKPDVHVNAADYGKPENWIEWPVMQELGIKPHVVEIRPGFSTSDLVEKIRNTAT